MRTGNFLIRVDYLFGILLMETKNFINNNLITSHVDLP